MHRRCDIRWEPANIALYCGTTGTKQMGADCLIWASVGYGFAQKAAGSIFTVGADDISAALHESEHY